MANSDDEFEEQLRQEAAEQKRQTDLKTGKIKVDPDGTVYDWDKDKKAWFPRVDEDFLARYQMSYGTNTGSNTEITDTGSSSNTNIPPAPDVTDPAYAEWYYKYYGSADSTSQAPYDTNSKEYREWYDYYYGENKEKTADEKGQSTDTSKESQEATEGKSMETETDNKKESNDNSSEIKSNETNDGSSSENKTTKGSKKDTLTDHSHFYAYYYKHYGHHTEGENVSEKKPAVDKPKLDPAMAEYWNQYHSASYDEEKMLTAEEAAKSEEIEEDEQEEEKGKKGKKRKAEGQPKPKEPPKWFDVDDTKNTNVYVAGLPSGMTDEEFAEMMGKCGLIMYDPVTKKPKTKLYKDKDGNNKGDGLCCYIKQESVDLALQIIDGSQVDGVRISVEKAKFQLKGSFDPKKKKKLTNSQKKKLKEKQVKLFDWRPDKPRWVRPKHEKVAVIKNFFDPKEFDTNPALINEIRQDLREECKKFGEVRKIMIFDRHPDGIATVNFKEPEEADQCIEALNRRFFAGRRIIAETWDGKSKFEIQESVEQEAKRLEQWENFLEEDDVTANTEKKSENTSGSGLQEGVEQSRLGAGEGVGASANITTGAQPIDAGSASA